MQFSIEVKLPSIPLNNPAAAAAIMDEELRLGLEAGVNLVRNQIVPLVPVNFGILRQGVQTEIKGQSVDLTGRVFNPVSYANAVETGSKPHWPPRGPLELWVRRKLRISDDGEVRSVAFAIARKISKDGTKAVNMFKNGTERARASVQTRMRLAHARMVERLVERLGGF